MKSLLLVSATLFSLSVLAGGSGGGGILTQMRVQSAAPEIVFSLGSSKGSVKFAHGLLTDGGWKIQKIEMPETAVSVEPSVFEALLKSEKTGTWEVIK